MCELGMSVLEHLLGYPDTIHSATQLLINTSSFFTQEGRAATTYILLPQPRMWRAHKACISLLLLQSILMHTE